MIISTIILILILIITKPNESLLNLNEKISFNKDLKFSNLRLEFKTNLKVFYNLKIANLLILNDKDYYLGIFLNWFKIYTKRSTVDHGQSGNTDYNINVYNVNVNENIENEIKHTVNEINNLKYQIDNINKDRNLNKLLELENLKSTKKVNDNERYQTKSKLKELSDLTRNKNKDLIKLYNELNLKKTSVITSINDVNFNIENGKNKLIENNNKIKNLNDFNDLDNSLSIKNDKYNTLDQNVHLLGKYYHDLQLLYQQKLNKFQSLNNNSHSLNHYLPSTLLDDDNYPLKSPKFYSTLEAFAPSPQERVQLMLALDKSKSYESLNNKFWN